MEKKPGFRRSMGVEEAEDNKRGRSAKRWKAKLKSEEGSGFKCKATLGFGLELGLGLYSSMKLSRQIGQKGSESSEQVIVRLHTWQKKSLPPPTAPPPPLSPSEDMSYAQISDHSNVTPCLVGLPPIEEGSLIFSDKYNITGP